MKSVNPVPQEFTWQIRHEIICARLRKASNAKILFVGDSITESWEREGGAVWEAYYGEKGALNFGIGGDCTEHVLWRLMNSGIDHIDPGLTVVMIGTNNTGAGDSPEETVAGISMIIRELLHRLPNSAILLLGIFPRSRYRTDNLRKINEVINKRLAQLDRDDRVSYLDIGNLFLDDSGELQSKFMPDYLHLSQSGYNIWAEQIKPTIDEVIDRTR